MFQRRNLKDWLQQNAFTKSRVDGKMFSKSDLERVGLFKENTFVFVGGEPYVPFQEKYNDNAHKNRQILTTATPLRKNSTQQGYFKDEFPRIFEGEAMNDPLRESRIHRLQSKKKNIRGGPFTPAQYPKKVHQGAYFDFPIERFDPRISSLAKQEAVKRNFVTNPGRKGGAGYPNRGFGDPPQSGKFKPISRAPSEPSLENDTNTILGGPFFVRRAIDYFDTDVHKPCKERYLKAPEDHHFGVKTVEPRKKVFHSAGNGVRPGGCQAGTFTRFHQARHDKYVDPPVMIFRAPVKPSSKNVDLNMSRQPLLHSTHRFPRPTVSIVEKNIQRSKPNNTKLIVYKK